jgi:hypothetical protein
MFLKMFKKGNLSFGKNDLHQLLFFAFFNIISFLVPETKWQELNNNRPDN